MERRQKEKEKTWVDQLHYFFSSFLLECLVKYRVKRMWLQVEIQRFVFGRANRKDTIEEADSSTWINRDWVVDSDNRRWRRRFLFIRQQIVRVCVREKRREERAWNCWKRAACYPVRIRRKQKAMGKIMTFQKEGIQKCTGMISQRWLDGMTR